MCFRMTSKPRGSEYRLARLLVSVSGWLAYTVPKFHNGVGLGIDATVVVPKARSNSKTCVAKRRDGSTMQQASVRYKPRD